VSRDLLLSDLEMFFGCILIL